MQWTTWQTGKVDSRSWQRSASSSAAYRNIYHKGYNNSNSSRNTFSNSKGINNSTKRTFKSQTRSSWCPILWPLWCIQPLQWVIIQVSSSSSHSIRILTTNVQLSFKASKTHPLVVHLDRNSNNSRLGTFPTIAVVVAEAITHLRDNSSTHSK